MDEPIRSFPFEPIVITRKLGHVRRRKTRPLCLCWRLKGRLVEGCFRLTPLLTKVLYPFRMVVIVRECVIDSRDVEIKLIGGICRCVATILVYQTL